MKLDLEQLDIICYPDPRLRAKSAPIEDFNGDLGALAARMIQLMRDAKGVGLAAPQVGLNIRMFVMNPTGKDGDDRVVINPRIGEREGAEVSEEGCLSIPEVRVDVRRALRCTLEAQDLRGEPVRIEGEDLIARIWQHETDHLDGVLILDRMSPADAIATKQALAELEADYRARTGT